MSEAHIAEVEGRVTVADDASLLSPEMLERIVRAVIQRMGQDGIAERKRETDKQFGPDRRRPGEGR